MAGIRMDYFTRRFSWLFAFEGLDLPILLPVGFFLLFRLGRGADDDLVPLIIFLQKKAGYKVPVVV